MLLHLNIQNFAIVRSLELDWHHGMTTITGETGAGKSIAIDALGLCLGERATTNVVRPHCKKAELSATFDVKENKYVQSWLANHDLTIDDECILRRVISAEGRSKAYINGSAVPLAQLKELGRHLLNIHGQHDHQLIVKTSEQRHLLDNFAHHQNLLDDVKYYYQHISQLQHELTQLQNSQLQREAQQQLLQYQVNELNEFSLEPQEFEALELDYKKYSNAQDILNETMSALQTLSDDEHFNVIESLRKNSEQISRLSKVDQELNNVASTLEESLIQIEDAVSDLRQYHDQLDLDPQIFSSIETRYSMAIQLAKKHQVSPNAIPDLHIKLSQELASISSSENRLSSINEDIERATNNYLQASKLLNKSRNSAASKLSKLITKSMQELNMPHGMFSVKINQSASNQFNSHGTDDIMFMVSINPGQPQEAMHKVASGGELSRISLAMQVVLADKVITPTLIFDEVDVGISGPTAAMVGSKLQTLAKNTQVICVTHLPQVACKGHQQLMVAKMTDGEHTETTVRELSGDGRVKEIARLLAGDTITANSLANAQELLAS